MIDNEFENKKVTQEFRFNRFALDFAWVEDKKCIEIDGSQHDRYDKIKQNDRIKDELLIADGWTILRIKWKDLYNDTKKWIKIAKDFIDG